MDKLWHGNSTIRKKIPVIVRTSKLASATENRTNSFNLLSKFTADSHQLERESFQTKQLTLHNIVYFHDNNVQFIVGRTAIV
jgi:hypothetical protein